MIYSQAAAIRPISCGRLPEPYAQRRKRFTVQSLECRHASGHWEELVVEDRRSTPAEIAACRLDFQAWLRRLDRRRRAVAKRLAAGESTGEVACHFRVSTGRISQYRAELRDSWQAFQGERLAVVA